MSSYGLTLRLKLRTRKKLLIGSRSLELDPALDVPFARITYGEHSRLYLPASTLKGVLRTALTRVAEHLGFKVSTKSVEPSVLTREATSNSTDIICSLFGRPKSPKGKVCIIPALINEKTYKLTHVRIDDETRTAESGGLYTAEYIPIGCEFEMDLEAKELDLEEAEALFTAIAAMNYERFGRSGLMDVKIDVTKSTIPPELIKKSPIVREIVEVIGT
ncbi:MAG: RAMP superfamily CRISPR-associated protein [Aigarchaeota archaeon]|nr:RAMP superfamily CRISPR-associated protein [Aigarchaeota archaeon]